MQVRPLSARNPRLQRLARLARRREERAAERAFLVEGPTLIGAALDAGVQLSEVFVASDAETRPAVADILARLTGVDALWEVPAAALERAGDAVTSQGIIAVAARTDPPFPTPATAPFVLVLVDIADPGNLGTLIRSGAAAGAGAVVVAGGVDPTGPKVVRSSAGAVFGVPVIEIPERGPDVIARLAAQGYRTHATVVRDGTSVFAADLAAPLAVVIGNEAHGLPAAVADAADVRITVPMAGPTESLNAAMAGTVVCFEVLRRSLGT